MGFRSWHSRTNCEGSRVSVPAQLPGLTHSTFAIHIHTCISISWDEPHMFYIFLYSNTVSLCFIASIRKIPTRGWIQQLLFPVCLIIAVTIHCRCMWHADRFKSLKWNLELPSGHRVHVQNWREGKRQGDAIGRVRMWKGVEMLVWLRNSILMAESPWALMRCYEDTFLVPN